MKRLLLASAPSCLLGVTLSGCYWLASYQDLTSGLGEDAGPEADAQTTDSFVTVADSTVDAEAGEVGAEAGPFCPLDAGPLTYCMDFDGVDASTLQLQTDQASAAIVSGVYVSPPSSLHVKLFGTASGAAYYVEFPFQPTTARLEFEIRNVALGQWVTLLSIGMHTSEQIGENLNVVVSPSGVFEIQEYFSLPDGGNAQGGQPGVPVEGGADPDVWHHVVLSLTVNDSTQTYLCGLTVDGQVLQDQVPLTLSWAQGNASIGVGVTYGGGGGPEFYFDNVRADFGL